MNLEGKLKQLADRLSPRQKALDFVRTDRWQRLPHANQQVCRQTIAKLLRQVVTQIQEDEHE